MLFAAVDGTALRQVDLSCFRGETIAEPGQYIAAMDINQHRSGLPDHTRQVFFLLCSAEFYHEHQAGSRLGSGTIRGRGRLWFYSTDQQRIKPLLHRNLPD